MRNSIRECVKHHYKETKKIGNYGKNSKKGNAYLATKGMENKLSIKKDILEIKKRIKRHFI